MKLIKYHYDISRGNDGFVLPKLLHRNDGDTATCTLGNGQKLNKLRRK